nr:hypothetical protein OJOKFFHK_00014 [uncultured bacterium]
MRVKKAGLLTSKSFYLPYLPAFQQWQLKAFVIRYSGATVRDLHPFPYSLLAVARSTFSLDHCVICVDDVKNINRLKDSIFSGVCQDYCTLAFRGYFY